MNENRIPAGPQATELDRTQSVHYLLNQIMDLANDNGAIIDGARRWEDSIFYDAKKDPGKPAQPTPTKTPDTVMDKLTVIYNTLVENNDQARMHRNVLEGALLPV